MKFRPLHHEPLEDRRLLAVDMLHFQNPLLPGDVNADSHQSSLDALLVINKLNAPENHTQQRAFYDSNGDGAVAPIDILVVVNALNDPTPSKQTPRQQFRHLVEQLQDFPEELTADAQRLSIRMQDAVEEYVTASDEITRELKSFLESDATDHTLKESHFHNLRETVQVVDQHVRKRIRRFAEELSEERAQPTERFAHPYNFHRNFDWSQVERPQEAVDAIYDEIISLADEDQTPPEPISELLDTFEGSTEGLRPYVQHRLETVRPPHHWRFPLQPGRIDHLIEQVINSEKLSTYLLERFDGFMGTGTLSYKDPTVSNDTTGILLVLEGTDQTVELSLSQALRTQAAKLHGQTVTVIGRTSQDPEGELPEQQVINVSLLRPNHSALASEQFRGTLVVDADTPLKGVLTRQDGTSVELAFQKHQQRHTERLHNKEIELMGSAVEGVIQVQHLRHAQEMTSEIEIGTLQLLTNSPSDSTAYELVTSNGGTMRLTLQDQQATRATALENQEIIVFGSSQESDGPFQVQRILSTSKAITLVDRFITGSGEDPVAPEFLQRLTFPKHWGEPPTTQTKDLRPLPGGFGMGSSTLYHWIRDNLQNDGIQFDFEDIRKTLEEHTDSADEDATPLGNHQLRITVPPGLVDRFMRRFGRR